MCHRAKVIFLGSPGVWYSKVEKRADARAAKTVNGPALFGLNLF